MPTQTAARSEAPAPSPERGAYFHLLVVYVVWGSTFVAMRAAVMGDSGFKPFSVGASRLAVASLLLFAWAILRKVPLRLSRRDLWVSAVSGVVIWVTGNGFTMWAEQTVDAGYAALVFSTVPIWTALIGNMIDRRLPSARLCGAFVVAIAGMAVLGGSGLFHAGTHLLKPTLVILSGTVLWGMTTHLQKRLPIHGPLFVSSAYQQFFGALGFFLMVLIMGEPWPHPTRQAWFAWGYLVLFGSIIAYSSYIAVVRKFPATIAMTFAYVCPVLAVLFGALLLKETISPNKIVGMGMILGAVYLIFKEQRVAKKQLRL